MDSKSIQSAISSKEASGEPVISSLDTLSLKKLQAADKDKDNNLDQTSDSWKTQFLILKIFAIKKFHTCNKILSLLANSFLLDIL